MGNIVSSFSSAPSSESPENYVSSSSSAPSSESPEKYVPSSEPPKKYDVFINFRGDTRNIFTRHLYDALKRNKIETYIDYRIEKGDEVWPAIVEAIENSLLFLVIFSQDYASSTWCLKELDRILEVTQGQKRRVIPVFYNIEPTHVRKQNAGTYKEAFSEYENSNHSHQVGRWKAALAKAANFSGFDSSAYSGNEVALIEDIVTCVLRMLGPLNQTSYFDGLFGIQEQIAQVEALMCNESRDVRYIGIWGMGGIGKTKIALELFNKLCFEFESSCFLSNVREKSQKSGIINLKNKLFSKLLEDKESHINVLDGITTHARRRLSRKKVLIVLDDVTNPEQLQELVGDHKWFGLGSRVIITTRDKQVLAKLVNEIYLVRTLEFPEALQLFYLNAFENDRFDEEFEELSREVVNYAKGIPLVLITLGSLLYGKDKDKWKSQLNKLKTTPCKEVQEILKLSYEELDSEEKNIFLGIACILKGGRVEIVKSLFDTCDYSIDIVLAKLQDKALITISNKVVSMHDLLQTMGRQIFRENFSGEQSWLWDPNDIYQVLHCNKESEFIKGISFDASKSKELELSPLVFAKTPELKFLEIYYSREHILYLPQGTLDFLPNELRCLRWNECPLKSLPSKFSPEKLVEVRMPRSEMRTMWDGVQNLVNLKVMDLSYSRHLIELPDFSKALSLEYVNLRCCSRLSKVHPSILSLQSLEELDLAACDALTSLKSDVHLKSLRSLRLNHCSRLKEFSITAENMICLDLEATGIDGLPSCIGHMFKLEYLLLSMCDNLKNISINLFDDLQSLQDLRLNECTKLQCLPELPPSIKGLYANGCSFLETVTSVATGKTTFKNCNKLSEDSVKAIQANLMVHINRSLSQLETCSPHRYSISVMYPGSRVPEWFKYRTTRHSITIDLSSVPPSMDWGLIFCICVGPTQTETRVRIHCRLLILGDQTVGQGDAEGYNQLVNVSDFTSDHVFLCYKEHFCHKMHQSIKKSRATSNSKIVLIMEVLSEDIDSIRLIKECGVCPTYESEYQVFMEPMGLESQARASGMGVGRSHQNNGDEFKRLIVPHHQTATWNNRTQGFKDIIMLL